MAFIAFTGIVVPPGFRFPLFVGLLCVLCVKLPFKAFTEYAKAFPPNYLFFSVFSVISVVKFGICSEN